MSYDSFGSLTRLPDGRLMAAWRSGTDHIASGDGVIKASLSADGVTWGTPWTLWSEVGRDSRVGRLAMVDGMLLCTYYEWIGTDDLVGNYVSVLHGDPADPMAAWAKRPVTGSDLDLWGASMCRVEPIDAGLYGLPLYGGRTGDAQYSSVYMVSADAITWSQRGVVGRDAARPYNEPNVVHLGGGNLLALLRTGTSPPLTLYESTSDDNGATWSTPTAVFDGVGAPILSRISGGRVVTQYRNNSRQGAMRIRSAAGVWGPERVLPETFAGTGYLYGDVLELSRDRLAWAYWQELSSSSAGGRCRTLRC